MQVKISILLKTNISFFINLNSLKKSTRKINEIEFYFAESSAIISPEPSAVLRDLTNGNYFVDNESEFLSDIFAIDEFFSHLNVDQLENH